MPPYLDANGVIVPVTMADRAVATVAGVGTGLVAASSVVAAVPVAVANPAVGSRVRWAVAASAVAPVAARASVGSAVVVCRASAVVHRAMEVDLRPGPEWRVRCV